MALTHKSGISIQVSLSGYSFKVTASDGDTSSSPWLGPDRIFTTPQLQQRYDEVEISLLTPKVTVVPEQFFTAEIARKLLSEVLPLRDTDAVDFEPLPSLGAIVIYSNSIDEALSKAVAQTVRTVGGASAKVLPELYYILRDLSGISDYNKILASYMDGYLHLAISQGRSLLLANTYQAADFTTAEYFIFMALKKLQLNPEQSSIYFRTPVSEPEEMSLYRYFKSVETR